MHGLLKKKGGREEKTRERGANSILQTHTGKTTTHIGINYYELEHCNTLELSLKKNYKKTHWRAADAEIKLPSGESTKLKHSPFKA